MPANLSTPDTVLVCRPNQLREAAVVLSCFPAAAQPALFVMEPPPCTEAEYIAMHESYRTMRNLRDEALGSRRSRLNLGRRGQGSGLVGPGDRPARGSAHPVPKMGEAQPASRRTD